jgi:hypothetical protein
VQIRKLFHQIGQNLAISDTSNVDFPKPDQNVTTFSRATIWAGSARSHSKPSWYKETVDRRAKARLD